MIYFSHNLLKKTLQCTKHAFYIKSSKPGTYLARALNSINKSSKPIKFKLSKNIYMSNPLKIVKKFSSHLSNLYSETNTFHSNKVESFFSKITLPQTFPYHNTNLEKPIEVVEVITAIKELK